MKRKEREGKGGPGHIESLDHRIQVRYRIGLGPRDMQLSMRKLKLTLTLTDIGGAVLTLMLGFRSLYITWQ